MEIDENKLNTLLGKIVTEMGAAAIGPLITIGDKLRFYKVMEAKGSASSVDLGELLV